jgi:hypothetical protein
VLYFNREIFIQHLEACHRQCMVCKKFYYRKLLKSFHKFLSFLRMHNQIIHNFKHVHVDYNPLKGMLVLILSLKLSTVPYAAGAESRGHSRTVWLYIDVNCFPSFIVRWILNFVDQPTHENPENWYPTNKSDFTVMNV